MKVRSSAHEGKFQQTSIFNTIPLIWFWGALRYFSTCGPTQWLHPTPWLGYAKLHIWNRVRWEAKVFPIYLTVMCAICSAFYHYSWVSIGISFWFQKWISPESIFKDLPRCWGTNSRHWNHYYTFREVRFLEITTTDDNSHTGSYLHRSLRRIHYGLGRKSALWSARNRIGEEINSHKFIWAASIKWINRSAMLGKMQIIALIHTRDRSWAGIVIWNSSGIYEIR